ncbi:hypothetical protein CV770_34380 [Bradyrhizobium sp. AC87j1]|nr:hypothetical protein CV770_34380 [Bradyrhizobium sp. AC87j1]
MDPAAEVALVVMFACHLLFTPVAVWAALSAAGPRPHGRVVEMLDFEPVDGKLRAQTFRLMRSNSLAADDDRAILVELSGGRLRQLERSLWSLNERASHNLYRFVIMTRPPDGIVGKRYWIVVPDSGKPWG